MFPSKNSSHYFSHRKGSACGVTLRVMAQESINKYHLPVEGVSTAWKNTDKGVSLYFH